MCDLTICLEPLYAAAATFCFARIFNVKRREAVFSAFAGGLVWGVFLAARYACRSELLSLFSAALFAGLMSEVLAKALKKPVTLFVVPSMIPLVPGANLYQTMVEAVSGQYDKAFQTGMQAMLIAGAIATGLAFSASLSRTYGRVRLLTRPS